MFTFIMAWCSRQLVLRNGIVYRRQGFGQRFRIAAASKNWSWSVLRVGGTFYLLLQWLNLV